MCTEMICGSTDQVCSKMLHIVNVDEVEKEKEFTSSSGLKTAALIYENIHFGGFVRYIAALNCSGWVYGRVGVREEYNIL